MQNVSVAELVQKYQDYLPAQGVQDLAQTALAPPVVSESEQEYPTQVTVRPGMARTKNRHRLPPRKVSTSDFEQGYAANVAPRYLVHPRKSLYNTASRISGQGGAAVESRESSRRPSPEKRTHPLKDTLISRPSSPFSDKLIPSSLKLTKTRIVSRSKDKPPARTPTTPGNKTTFRRSSAATGNKVTTIARHYERLGREAERSKGRYAVIRSRPARPVIYARAKVEVLDSVKDAIADDSESSNSSSEADDEDEGNDEDRPAPPLLQRQSPSSEPATSSTVLPSEPEVVIQPEPTTQPEMSLEPPQVSPTPEVRDGETTARLLPPGQITLPSSPFLKAVKSRQDMALTPPTDMDLGTERSSFLKALSVFWLQPTRNSIEGDDPMNDPEHIFRDSSMVVRLDEPTSIIALALK